MFCATVLVASGCFLACNAPPEEFVAAWQPTYSNELQVVVDKNGNPWPTLARGKNGAAIWAVPADPAACAPIPAFKPTE